MAKGLGSKCVGKILAATGKITKKVALQIIKELNRKVKRGTGKELTHLSNLEKLEGLDDVINLAREQQVSHFTMLQIIKERSAIQSLIDDVNFVDSIKRDARIATVEGDIGYGKAFLNRTIQVLRDTDGLANKMVNNVQRDIVSDAEVLSVFKDPKNGTEIVSAVWDSYKNENYSHPNSSINTIVKSIRQHSADVVKMGNSFNAYILDFPELVFNSAVIDPELLPKSSKEFTAIIHSKGIKFNKEWVEELTNTFITRTGQDTETIFNTDIALYRQLETEAINQHLEDVYKMLVTGQRKVELGETRVKPTELMGNVQFKQIGVQLGRTPLLPFQDGVSFNNYLTEFSRSSVSDIVLSAADRHGRELSLLQNVGVDPIVTMLTARAKLSELSIGNPVSIAQLTDATAANITNQVNTVINRAKGKNIGGAIEALGGLSKDIVEPNIRDMIAQVSGKTRIPSKSGFAKLGSIGRSLSTVLVLGNAALKQLSDIPAASSLLKSLEPFSEGGLTQGILGRVANIINESPEARISTIEAMAPHEAFLILLNKSKEDFDTNARFSGADKLQGYINAMFKLTALPAFENSIKTEVALRIASGLGEITRQFEFSKVMSDNIGDFGTAMTKHGVTEEHFLLWKAGLMDSPPQFFSDKYVSPDLFLGLEPQQIREAIPSFAGKTDAEIMRLQTEAFSKISSMQFQRITESSPLPGSVERATLTKGTTPGTAVGEVVRSLALLKSFGVTQILRTLPAVFEQGGIRGLGKVMGQAFISSLIIQVVNDAIIGKAPPSFEDKANWSKYLAKAFIASGAGGIYSDIFFKDTSGFGQDFTTQIAGPEFGALNDLFSISSDVVTGDVNSLVHNQSRKVLRKYGFVNNLTYSKALLKYAIMDHINEALKEGSVDDSEATLRRLTGQEFIFDNGDL